MNKKILQIVPSTGYRAVYANEPGSNTPAFDIPVAVFALIEEANENVLDTRVIPIIITESSDDAESDNYLGIVGPGIPKEQVGSVIVEYGKESDRIFKIVKKTEEIKK